MRTRARNVEPNSMYPSTLSLAVLAVPFVKPYVQDDITRKPVVVDASLCEGKGYGLMREDISFCVYVCWLGII